MGEAKAAANGGITFTATYSDVAGTGGYEGVRGDGSFEGRRIEVLTVGGETYFRGTLRLAAGTD